MYVCMYADTASIAYLDGSSQALVLLSEQDQGVRLQHVHAAGAQALAETGVAQYTREPRFQLRHFSAHSRGNAGHHRYGVHSGEQT